MAQYAAGRHRAPGRFNPLTELTGIVAQSAQPAVKTSAVLAASGGLVAAFAVPAQAASAETAAKTETTAAIPVAAVKAPSAPAPAQTAFGEIGFSATAKPKPAPAPAPAPEPAPAPAPEPAPAPQRVEQAVSRAVERAPLAAPQKASSDVLAIAAKYEGVPYVYGGTSPETGFDCSGYTQYVFRQLGINLPRTAEEQRQFVTPVSSPQPGDLIFFGTPAYHMGIYAGNGKMWDAPRSGRTVGLHDIWSTDVTYGRP